MDSIMELKIIGLTSIVVVLTLILPFTLGIFPCHRKKERCYKFLRNDSLRICSRCCSILLGYYSIIPMVLFDLNNYLSLKALLIIALLLQLPMLIDGITQAKGFRISNNFLRTITGLASGVGLSMIIYVVGFCIKI